MDKIGTRVQAYIALFNPTKEELANTTKVKMCKELAKVTSFSESTWSNNDVLKNSHIEAVECAKMKTELERVETLFWTLYGSSSIMMSLSDEDGDYISEFLNREEK